VRSAGGPGAEGDDRRDEVATRALALLAALAIGIQSAPAADPRLARAAEYIDRFERDFGQLIGDERYDQHVSGADYPHAERRRTQSEMLFVWMPRQGDWLTVRNVRSVDGRPIAGSERRLTDAITSTDNPVARLRQLRDDSARFNIGRTFRNINYPTMALHFLEAKNQPRMRFVVEQRDTVAGVDGWRVGFTEQQTPTLVQDEHGESLYAHGTVWIADRDGTVLRTRLEIFVASAPTSMSATVDYGRDAKLSMWVPRRMREEYMQRVTEHGSRIAERITATAIYTNYRRFETSGRIIR